MSDPAVLKPCPFCGSEDIALDGDDLDMRVQCLSCLCEGPVATVGCRDEEEDGPIDIRAEATELWNSVSVAREKAAVVAPAAAEDTTDAFILYKAGCRVSLGQCINRMLDAWKALPDPDRVRAERALVSVLADLTADVALGMWAPTREQFLAFLGRSFDHSDQARATRAERDARSEEP